MTSHMPWADLLQIAEFVGFAACGVALLLAAVFVGLCALRAFYAIFELIGL